MFPAPAMATLEVNVTRVGFPTLRQGDVVRNGIWAPVLVDISLTGAQTAAHGTVRIGQPDADGDEAYDVVPFSVRMESGGAQRLYLYILPNLIRTNERLVVELFDAEGQALEILSQGELTYQARPAAAPSTISDDALLVLSVSTGTMGPEQDLAAASEELTYAHQVHVGHISPVDLPERWIGLEAVDYIIWDDAHPEHLSARQVEALLEWVRQGGTLMIAASRSAAAVRLEPAINALLPVDIGEVRSIKNLPDLRRELLGEPPEPEGRKERPDTPWWAAPLPKPVPVVDVQLRDTGRYASDRLPSDEATVLTRRHAGRGEIIFSAITLKDLLSGGGRADPLFQELFHLPVLRQSEWAEPAPVSLFRPVAAVISFATSGGLYLLFAFLFAVGYVLAATLGLWGVLGLRGWRRHSWTAFALVGGAAGLISVAAVNAMRGFGETLRQVTILDAWADSGRAYATALFGVKTAMDRRLDFWLPPDPLAAREPVETNGFLRPLAESAQFAESRTSFADPVAYRIQPSVAVLEDVRLRGTLKRMEGRWTGPLNGRLTAEIAARGLYIEAGSYVQNELGVDLRNCYLFHTTRDPDPGVGFRSSDIRAFPVGDLPADGNRVDLRERCYRPDPDESMGGFLTRSTLANAQRSWGAELRSVISQYAYDPDARRSLVVGQERNALLLLSTVGEYDPSQDPGMIGRVWGVRSWSRDRLRHLDLSRHFRTDVAILVGFADEPGPVRLFARYGDRSFSPLDPEPGSSWAMYRFLIPVNVKERAEYEEEDTSDTPR